MPVQMGSFMKIEKKLLMIITFIGALVILLLAFYFVTGFKSGIKDIIGALYFAIWITALMGLWLYILKPYLDGRPKKKDKKDSPTVTGQSMPVQSPRSNLPLRDRIREYVSERRKEDGLPAPEPLRPSGSASSAGRASSSVSGQADGHVPVSTPSVSVGEEEMEGLAPGAGEGDLPLPDDFDDNGTGDLFGDDSGEEDNGVSLPGIEDESFDSLDDGIGDEEPVTESGDLPDFEGDLEPDMSDSGLGDLPDDLSDDGLDDDLSDDDRITDPGEMPADESDEVGDAGLSDEGLPDLDMPIDDSMMDEDIGGDDLADIEFEDLEPDEI